MRSRRRLARGIRGTGILVVLVALVATGCGTRRTGAKAFALESFGTCRALLSHIRTEALGVVGPYGLQTSYGFRGEAALGAPQPATANQSGAAKDAVAAPAAGKDYSGTNVQEEGVDEPDIVKTDGTRILALAGNRLEYVSVQGTPRLAGTLTLPTDLMGAQLLLAGDRALVIGTAMQSGSTGGFPKGAPGGPAMDMAYYPMSTRTLVAVVDVSDPAKMKVSSSLYLDGNYVAARLAGGVVRMVLTAPATGPALRTPAEGTPAAVQAAADGNRAAVRQSAIEDWLPNYTLVRGSAKPETGEQVACGQVYKTASFSGLGTVTVVTIDPENPKPSNGVSVLGDAQTVYASMKNIYVTTTKWNGPIAYSEGVARDVVEPNTAVRSDTTTSSGSSAPGVAVAPAPVATQTTEQITTEIHKFDISDPKTARYVASGSLPGQLLSQWSMSEHEGYLRVATTVGEAWNGGSESFVTVLADKDHKLVAVGRVGNLGRGERIYAVRFIGTVGYVVTFRQTDPLYTVNLSNPAAPKVIGQLKINGYSAYLHPVGEDLILGVGQDADAQGRVQGLQVSLFDVSNLAAPKRIAQAVVASGHTEAESDPHAFLFWPATRTLVLPVQAWNAVPVPMPAPAEKGAPDTGGSSVEPGGAGSSAGSSGGAPASTVAAEPGVVTTMPMIAPAPGFVGAIAFKVGTSTLKEIARITHPSTESGPVDMPSMIQRSLVVGGSLFTVSNGGILASDLTTLAKVRWIPWE